GSPGVEKQRAGKSRLFAYELMPTAMAAADRPTTECNPHRRCNRKVRFRVGRSTRSRTGLRGPPQWRPGKRRPPYGRVRSASTMQPEDAVSRRAVNVLRWPPGGAAVPTAVAAGKAPTALRPSAIRIGDVTGRCGFA